MKTLEGVELKLGKCKLMPVKRVDKFDLDLDHLEKNLNKHMMHAIRESKPIIGTEQAPLGPDGKPRAFMPKNPYLELMEEKYYQKILSKLKPANYKD